MTQTSSAAGQEELRYGVLRLANTGLMLEL